MIAFDTNHLIRHLVQDDEVQCKIVSSILKKEALNDRCIRISDLVLLESSWVLQAVYRLDRMALVEVFEELLDDSAFSFDDPMRLRFALKLYKEGNAEFADYLILTHAKAEGLELKTFDKRLQREISKHGS